MLSPELLVHAYCTSYFPMAEMGGLICWHSPDPRAVFPLQELTLSRSLRKSIEKAGFEHSINAAFEAVIEHCARRDREDEVWISDDIIAHYTQLHEEGIVHSVETWYEGSLVGGLYGVSIGAAFFGESMFSLRSNASKAAFAFLLRSLQERDFMVLDTQYLNHFTEQLGAVEIPRNEYMQWLERAIGQPRSFGEGN